MAITNLPIRPNNVTKQVARLTNGWLVTAYQYRNNGFQLLVSKNDGATWSDLCKFEVPESLTVLIDITALIAVGVNVLVVGKHGDVNNFDYLLTCYFNSTTVATTTNIYDSRSSGPLVPYISNYRVKLDGGWYHYLNGWYSSNNDADYKSHNSVNNTNGPGPGSMYLGTNRPQTEAWYGDSDVHTLSNGGSWVFYGSGNTLKLRRTLSPNTSPQAVQNLVTLPANSRIRRIRVIELSGTIYIFYSWLSNDNSSRGIGVITTTNGTTFSVAKTLLNNPFATTSDQPLDFDALVDGDNIALLLAIPNGANRVMYIGKYRNNTLSIKATGVTVANKSIYSYSPTMQSIAVNNRQLYFSVDLINGTNLIKFRLDVEGIKQLVNGTWTNIEQAYRHNGAVWQEQNGKRMNGSVWQDIT